MLTEREDELWERGSRGACVVKCSCARALRTAVWTQITDLALLLLTEDATIGSPKWHTSGASTVMIVVVKERDAIMYACREASWWNGRGGCML